MGESIRQPSLALKEAASAGLGGFCSRSSCVDSAICLIVRKVPDIF